MKNGLTFSQIEGDGRLKHEYSRISWHRIQVHFISCTISFGWSKLYIVSLLFEIVISIIDSLLSFSIISIHINGSILFRLSKSTMNTCAWKIFFHMMFINLIIHYFNSESSKFCTIISWHVSCKIVCHSFQ